MSDPAASAAVAQPKTAVEQPSETVDSKDISIPDDDKLKHDGTNHELTYFERKASLINEELDKLGFGRYQQCIWMLCGFGYFLDLAWSQGVGLIASAIYQEMDVPAGRQGLIFTCANAGLAVGAFSFGIITDIIGRKWAFNLTCLITSVFGMLLAACKYNYGAICGVYFLASIGLGGNIPIDATIALEFMPPKRRYLVSLMSMWQPVGVVVASAIAYGTAARYRCETTLPACNSSELGDGEPCCSVSGNMGWRYTVIVIGSMTLFIFFARYFIFRFHESPKFLVSKGREQDAIDVLHKIAKFNGAPMPTLTIEDFRAIDREMGIEGAELSASGSRSDAKGVFMRAIREISFLRGLFTNKLACYTFVLLGLAYMGNYWSFNLAGAFLPIILLRNNVDAGASSVTETYRQYIYIYLPGIIGAIIALFSVQLPLLGRKWSLVISAALQGLSMALYTQVKTTAGYVGLNALEYIMQTYFNAVLYASAPELFDTTYRASASGMLSTLGRIAGIVAPFAGQKYIDEGRAGVLWLGAGGIWLSSVLMVFLPVEMRNREMY
ncbi:major facilitator superfamily domain-containing protein [Aspergillus karnatakaensis]|uniref:major facilitator superfamily domain-containing protein n=1 Tax=Aspergillus karnatakaensis TaxID=1810916 RepID=UPI003CCDEF34